MLLWLYSRECGNLYTMDPVMFLDVLGAPLCIARVAALLSLLTFSSSFTHNLHTHPTLAHPLPTLLTDSLRFLITFLQFHISQWPQKVCHLRRPIRA